MALTAKDYIELGFIDETITEPMIALKKYVSTANKKIVKQLEPYKKANNLDDQQVTDHWEYFMDDWISAYEAIKEKEDYIDGDLDFPEDYLEDENDIERLIDLMNENPKAFYNIVSTLKMTDNRTKALMDYQKPLVNKWFVHFTKTDYAWDIFYKGFTMGNEDMTRLGLTVYDDLKRKKHGDYLFAYETKDKHYATRTRNKEFKYGETAIVFMASGVKFYHYGDQEPQVVFDKRSPTGCYMVKKEETEREDERAGYVYVIYGHEKGKPKKIASKEHFSDAVDWIETNHEQYKKYYGWKK